MKTLLEDPLDLADQLNQFLRPSFYTWAEIMSIMNVLLTGEERGIIRRIAMNIWEEQHPPGQEVLPAEHKFPNIDPNGITITPKTKCNAGPHRTYD